jgi:RimJ/RimL family protein N-acetyltransferase
MQTPVLEGQLVRLEPLTWAHAEPLAQTAAGADLELYRWTQVPRTPQEAERYIGAALAMHAAGTALPFATVRRADGLVVGSTRIFNVERWSWPEGHERHNRKEGDVAEIGYTWLGTNALRSGINTEAKLLLLTHAFEALRMLGVCLYADARNQRSRAAIQRLGGRFDGILRAHRLATDLTARDSARYSFVASEWPQVRERILALVRR